MCVAAPLIAVMVMVDTTLLESALVVDSFAARLPVALEGNCALAHTSHTPVVSEMERRFTFVLVAAETEDEAAVFTSPKPSMLLKFSADMYDISPLFANVFPSTMG